MTEITQQTQQTPEIQKLAGEVTIADVKLEPYSDKSFKASGEATRALKEDIKALGGKWNPRLRNGPGWIFPNSKLERVQKFLETGKSTAPTQSDYQYITYRVIRPHIGMLITVDMAQGVTHGVITVARPNKNNTVTNVQAKVVDGYLLKTETGFDDFIDQTISLIICNGDWKIADQPEHHGITFKTGGNLPSTSTTGTQTSTE